MTVKDLNGGKLISLSKPFDTRGKYLNLFYFLNFFAAGTFFMRLIIVDSQPWGIIVLILVAVSVFYVAAYRFLNKALESEKILVDKNDLRLIRTGLLKSKEKSYEVSGISKFRHLGKPQLSKHPLAGESFDYLGFQTEQAVINEMHGDNRISFSYMGKTVSFGENIASWEFEELERLLYETTGKDLRRDDDVENAVIS